MIKINDLIKRSINMNSIDLEKLRADIISSNVNQKDIRAKNKLSTIIAIVCVVLVLPTLVYATTLFFGVGEVGNNNKDDILKPFTTESSNKDIITGNQIASNSDTVLLADINQENLFADFFGEVLLTQDINDYYLPEVYISPNHMAIFTMETGDGISFSEESNLELSFNLENQTLALEIGIIFDGIYYPLSETQGDYFTDNFIATASQEYYICITNKSSANAIIKNGIIKLG